MDHGGQTFDNILESARSGDGAGFEALFRRFNRQVASFASARHAPDPEGVVNEVFLRVFRALPTFDGNEVQFAGWLFRIARNLIIDDLRRRDRRPQELPDEALSTPASTDRPPATHIHAAAEDVALERDAVATIEHLLDYLSPEQRDIVLMRVVADQPIEVVAAALGKSVSAVKSGQFRAIRQLRQKLEKSSPERDQRDSPHVLTV